MLPWLEAELEDADAAMGEGVSYHGLEPTRGNKEAFCEDPRRPGLTSRRIGVDEYFGEFLAS